ncbi:MAG: response regulator transcription factor [Thermoanaerobaculia bacterium]
MTRGAPLLLVVDDEPGIRRAVALELEAAGFVLAQAEDGEAALKSFRELEPDLILTDLAMPRRDGLSLIREIRRSSQIPIVVLSVRGEEEDKVRALDAGADDYLTKPFSMRELMARVRAQLRRSEASAPALRRFAGLEIDVERRRVVQGDREIHLTPTELALLELLSSQPGRPLTFRQIIARVWRGAPATSQDTVRVHVSSLRRKLEPDPAEPRYIGTEPWVGYRFLAEPVDL